MKQTNPLPLVEAQGYQRSPLSIPVAGQNNNYSRACCACLQGFYLIPSFCLSGSFNFIFPNFFYFSTVGCVLSGKSEFSLVAGIQFVLSWYDSSWLRRFYLLFRIMIFFLMSGAYPWGKSPHNETQQLFTCSLSVLSWHQQVMVAFWPRPVSFNVADDNPHTTRHNNFFVTVASAF